MTKFQVLKFNSNPVFLTLLITLCAFHAKAADALKWSGDLRYRGAHAKEAVDDDRYYQQLRARLMAKAQVADDVVAVLQLATGSTATSTNQTLGDSSAPGMPRRNFGIDQAFADWLAFKTEDGAQGHFLFGRMANPFFVPARIQLVFDHDLAFEGMATKWTAKVDDRTLFANAAAFIVAENYAAPSDTVDTGFVALNLGVTAPFGATTSVTFFASRYHWSNIADRSITTIDAGARTDSQSLPTLRSKGNSVYSVGASSYYASGFVQTEGGFELKTKFDPIAVTVFADGVVNELGGSQKEAIEAGLVAQWGRGSLGAAWVSKQADSVVGAFTDSDSNGGGADSQGTRVALSYQLSDQASVALTDYRAHRGVSATEREFQMQHLDLNLKF